jgi:hypothetical protein
MESLGGADAWNNTHYLRFDFAVDRGGKTLVRRAHTWDKWTGRYRLESTTKEGAPSVVLMNVNTKEGSAFLKGTKLQGEAAKKYLEQAYGTWVNDTYWLLMPYKMKDPGVMLALDGEDKKGADAWDKVRLTFDNVGLTPKDKYWAYVNRKTGLVDRWDFVLKGEREPPSTFMWKNWKPYGKIQLADDRQSSDGTRRSSRRHRRRLAPAGGEELDEDEPGHEASDVRSVGDAAPFRLATEHAQAGDELEGEPDADRDPGGHLRRAPAHQHAHAPAGVQEHVAPEHTRDRTRRAEARHEGVAMGGDGREHVGQGREYSAGEIEEQVAQATQLVLEVVPEDPEVEHVAEKVREAAVHEHRYQQRQVHGAGSGPEARLLERLAAGLILDHARGRHDVPTGHDLLRDRRERVGEAIVRSHALEENEHGDVGGDQQVGQDRRQGSIGVVVGDGNHARWRKQGPCQCMPCTAAAGRRFRAFTRLLTGSLASA